MNIPIVDEEDTLLCYKERGTEKSEDIYRVSALWITNSKKEILLAKRALTKVKNPGKWGPAVAGTVEEGEDYWINIVKEAEEEIGLKNIVPLVGPKKRVRRNYNYFCQWYFLVVDKELSEFVIDEREVAEIRWFAEDDLRREMKSNPDAFLGSVQDCVDSFCK